MELSFPLVSVQLELPGGKLLRRAFVPGGVASAVLKLSRAPQESLHSRAVPARGMSAACARGGRNMLSEI
jgi:hypothetical protein